MTTLANSACTLRTLWLDFEIYDDIAGLFDDSEGVPIPNTSTFNALTEFVHQEDFSEAVVNLKVESMIKLSVKSRVAAYCTIFQEVVSAIRLKNQWAVSEIPCARPMEPNSYFQKFQKQWILAPTSPAIREQVPRLVEDVQGSSSKDRVVEATEDEP